MVAGTDAGRKALSGHWATPPWNEESPEWLVLDQRLSNGHLARWIDALVRELDLEGFMHGYPGVGVRAYRPDLLLKGVLYEMLQGRLSPAQWTRDFREVEPLRWLLFGLEPSRTCLYNFRDRVGSELEHWQQQILAKAQAEGHTQAERGAIDGTFTAAYASRYRLINAETLEKRWQELETAVAIDRAEAATAGSSVLQQVLALLPQTEATTAALVPIGEQRSEAMPDLVDQTLPTMAAAIPPAEAASSPRPGWQGGWQPHPLADKSSGKSTSGRGNGCNNCRSGTSKVTRNVPSASAARWSGCWSVRRSRRQLWDWTSSGPFVRSTTCSWSVISMHLLSSAMRFLRQQAIMTCSYRLSRRPST
jgi:transposase